MLSSGSQSQGDTQPVSQWVYEEFTSWDTAQRATRGTSDSNGNALNDQGDASHSIRQGETGHVDLLGIFEQPSHIGLNDPVEEDQEGEDIDPLSQTSSIHADVLAESRTFQQPKTPASQSKKRKRGSDVQFQQARTPSLPANPFAGQMGNSDGLMDPSQLFRATQALTSPLTNIVPSDGLSERPSPEIHNLPRPSTAATTSSPTRLSRSGLVRAVTEPQTEYISMKESQEARERLQQAMKAEQQLSLDEFSDDGFGSPDTQLRRRLNQKRINMEARAQFAGVTARSDLTASGRGRGRGGRTMTPPSRAHIRGNGREASAPVLISDNTPPEDVHGNVTEDETEREDDMDLSDGDEVDELCEDNKENVEVPMTISRAHHSTSQVISSQPTPSHRRLRKRKAGSQSKAAALLRSSPEMLRSQSAPRPTGEGTQTDAVADSQPSQPSARNKSNSAASKLPGSSEPQYSLDARVLVPQSQSSVFSKVNSPSDTRAEVQIEKAPSQDVINTSPKPRNSQKKREQNGHGTQTKAKAGEGEGQDPSQMERSTDAPPALELPSHPDNPHSTRARQVRRPATHHTTGSASVSQESPYHSSNLMPSPRNTPKSASQPTANYSMAENSRPSTLFETAQEYLSLSPSKSSAKRLQQRSQSQQVSPTRSKRPRTIGEIVADPSPLDEHGEVDVNINILSNEDVEFQRALSGSSPIGPASKRRRGGRGIALPIVETETSKLLSLPPSPLPPPSSAISAITPIPTSSEAAIGSPAASISTRRLSKKQENGLLNAGIKPSLDRKSAAARVAVPTPGREQTATGSGKNTQNRIETPSVQHQDIPTSYSVIEGLSRQPVTAPNRVFAHFNGTTPAYHPATCLQVVGSDDPRYTVRFDDGTVDTITAYSIKRLELRQGDLVKVDIPGSRNKTYVVEGMRDQQRPANPPDPATPSRRGSTISTNDPAFPEVDIHGFATVLVSPKQRGSVNDNPSVCAQIAVPIAQLYLTQTMWASFKDRLYTHIPNKSQTLTGLQTPSERPSTPSTPSSRSRRAKTSVLAQSRSMTSASNLGNVGLFRNMAFSITNVDRSEDSERLKTHISANGGTILEKGFDELFHIPPLTRVTAPREAHDETLFELTPAAKNLGFTCLIADRYCRRAKFVQALALGIPCLATRWITDCVAKQQLLPWETYLLPSGESSYLGGAVRSRILQLFPTETATLAGIIGNRTKMLENSSVLLIMEKGQEDTMRQHPLITHALGASKIARAINEDAAAKAVSDASALGEPWDWVFSYDKEKAVEERLFGTNQTRKKRKRGSEGEVLDAAGRREKRGRTRVVGNEFVIQSLILGMLIEE